jgi:hypothetical protein
LCYEGYLVNWVVIQAVLQRHRGEWWFSHHFSLTYSSKNLFL